MNLFYDIQSYMATGTYVLGSFIKDFRKNTVKIDPLSLVRFCPNWAIPLPSVRTSSMDRCMHVLSTK